MVIFKLVFSENLLWDMFIKWKSLFSYIIQSIRSITPANTVLLFPKRMNHCLFSFVLFNACFVFYSLISVCLFQDRPSPCRLAWNSEVHLPLHPWMLVLNVCATTPAVRIYLYLCVYVGVCVRVCTVGVDAQWGQRCWLSLELELQATVGHLKWVLAAELMLWESSVCS